MLRIQLHLTRSHHLSQAPQPSRGRTRRANTARRQRHAGPDLERIEQARVLADSVHLQLCLGNIQRIHRGRACARH